MEKKEPGYKARAAAERATKAREQATYRASLIKRYGGEAAAKAYRSPMEQAVNDAAAPFVTKVHKSSDGSVWPTALDGWTGAHGSNAPPARVSAAIRRAWPMPTTLTEALAEYEAWEERDKEIGTIWGEVHLGENLTLPCDLRRDIICNLLDHGMRATSITDTAVRVRWMRDHPQRLKDNDAAPLLADLEHLATLRPMSQHYTVTEKQCPACHRTFTARTTAKTCSPACRQRMSRSRRAA